MIQNYSCPASPFIMFLPFICLALPEDSPFWTARENEGFWQELADKSMVTVLENPGLVLVNHGKTGASEIIPGKVYYDDPNYSKLVYNTHFPWEDHDPQGGTSMEYSFRSRDPRDVRGEDVNFYLTGATLSNTSDRSRLFSTSQSMVFNGVRDGVLYRQALITYAGWDSVESLTHTDHNAEADDSTVIFARRRRTSKNPAMELMISVFLHRTDDDDWSPEELDPVKEIRIMDVTPAFSPLGTEITLRDGTFYKIYFEEIDGNRRS